ncbi:hypothetical protein [Sediminibacterium sp.]|uniref:hypothetical protein n=1 Tax=Sediminibacterium sp. TaxID=1917865 RepID=UPI003F6EA72E
MKKGWMLLLSSAITCFSFAQTEKPTYQHFNKGKSFLGIGISPVYSDMMGSYTDISITKGNTNLGILLAPMYGKFVQQNWMIGVMGIAGAHTERRNYETYPMVIGPGPGIPPPMQVKEMINNFDLGITPITRYYLSFNKRNSVAFFMQAALPAVYSTYSNVQKYSFSGGANSEIRSSFNQFSLRGSIGFGLSVQGKFGSFDTHVSNMGWFLSFNKLIQKK